MAVMDTSRPKFIDSRLILKVLSGSHAYGTNTEGSDLDYRGVRIPSAEYLLGLHDFETYVDGERDETIYSLRKFVTLALRNNPSILDVLFVDEDKIIFANRFGRELRALAKDFLSKKVYMTYGGYAKDQLEKMVRRGGKGTHGVRADRILEFGMDTKNALHLIRLLRMGCEILETGEVHVRRPDAAELLEIKEGRLLVEEVLEVSEQLQLRLSEAYTRTRLPDEPDTAKIETWMIDAHRRSLKWDDAPSR